MVIHKRMIDTSANGDYTHQLCNPLIHFAGRTYSYTQPEFRTWAESRAKYHWKYVTCGKCLWLGGKIKTGVATKLQPVSQSAREFPPNMSLEEFYILELDHK